MIEILRAGFAPDTVPYERGWELQRAYHQRIADGSADPALLLLEHDAVFTAGTGARKSEYPDDGTPVVPVTRGGKVTWHGPGQLVGYPILPLPPLAGDGALPHRDDPRHRMVDVVGHVRRLEGVLIHAIAAFGVTGLRIPGRSGVWVETARGPEKIAAIGIRVERGVSLHGFALNCENSLEPYRHFIPCGISDAGVTTLSVETGRRIGVAEAADVIAANFENWYTENVTEAAA